jgi:hypothetical protein
MSFVAAGTFVIGAESAAAIGALGTGLIGGALVGAGTGALVNGLSGRSVLNGALIGGAIGGLGGAIGGFGVGAEAAAAVNSTALESANTLAVSMEYTNAAQALANGVAPEALGLTEQQAAALAASQAAATTGTSSALQNAGSMAAKQALSPEEQVQTAAGRTLPPAINPQTVPDDYMQSSQEGYPLPPSSQPPGIGTYANKALSWMDKNKGLTAAGLGAAYLATRPNAFKPNYLTPYTPPTAKSYGLGATLSPNYRPTFAAAQGGIASLDKNFASGGMYPGSQIDKTQYSSSPQTPMSMQATMASYDPETNPLTGEPTTHMADGGTAQAPVVQPTAGGLAAAGITGLQQQAKSQTSQPITMGYIKSLADQYGVQIPSELTTMGPGNTPGVAAAAKGGVMGGQYNLGSYSDGGRLLKGPGDGMSDNIPASIAGKQPARLADGEFVVPADVVSHLGNGSTDAGAKHLYKMMDNVRKARTGRKAQSKQIKANKFLPK